MKDNIVKKSNIIVNVGLNENHVPQKILWSADDANIDSQEANAIFLSVWDNKQKNTLKIDLWTENMSIEEMKQFFHQALLSMADTFERATNEHLIMEDLRDYCYHFAEKMNILPEQ